MAKKRFVDNLPGVDFIRGFMKRHPELSVRTANLLKRSKAALSPEIVNSFFDLYTESAAGIVPANIYNYDETNLRDDPGQIIIFLKYLLLVPVSYFFAIAIPAPALCI